MTPIVHTIEVGEIIAARTWKVSSTQPPTIRIDGAIYSTRSLIAEWGDAIETPPTLESNNSGLWPTKGKLEATCIESAMELRPRDCKYICGAPCTQRLNAFRDGEYSACPCGIYAYNLAGVIYRTRTFEQNLSSSYARGLVALSGRVVEHTLGYRAEFARPVALFTRSSRSLDAPCEVALSLINSYGLSRLLSFTELIRALAVDEHRRENEPMEDPLCL